MHGWGPKLRLNAPWLLVMAAILPVGAHARPYKSKAIKAITGVYRGNVGGREIVLEVGPGDPEDEDLVAPEQADLPVLGRYFYRDEGAAFPLHGKFLKDGRLSLLAYSERWPSGAELRLTFKGGRGRGFFCNCYGSPSPPDGQMLQVSLIRVSTGFDPRLSPWLGPRFGPYLDRAYYDLLLDYPLKRAHEVRVNHEISYVMLSDPRFKVSLPHLTRFPDAKVMAKVNRKLAKALQYDRIRAADCLFTGRLPTGFCGWNEEEGHIALITRNLLSITREVSEISGLFEHSTVRIDPLIYNLRTGDFFYWQDFLRMKAGPKYWAGDSDGIVNSGTEHEILWHLYQAHASPPPSSCAKYGRPDLKAYFDKAGLVLMGEILGVELECSGDVIIPYSELRLLVRKNSPFRDLVNASDGDLLFAAPGWPQPSAKKFNDSGLAFYQKDRYDSAIHQYSEAIRLFPTYAQAFSNRGNAYLAKGEYDRAIEDYNQALRLKPDYFEALLDRGLSHDNQGHYDQAVHDYSEAIRLDPNYAEAFFQRGSDYNLLGDKDSAVRDIEQAFRLAGDDADWFLNVGNHYDRKHDYNHALRAFDLVIRLHPANLSAFEYRGDVFYHQGDYDRAIADYTHAGAFLERGLVYQKLGDYDRAIQDFTESLRAHPDFVWGHEQRCEAYLLKGDYQRAIEDCTEALRLQSQICRDCLSSNNYANRGLARLYAGEAESAYEDFGHSTNLWAEVWLYLAHARTAKAAQNQLKEHFLGSAPDTWPGPMFRLFFGDSTPEEVISTAGNNEKQKCEANLYLGEYYSLHGNRAQAQSLFQSVTESCSETLLESRIARAELKRMDLH
jgi:tetratricopeptide (TPR) repeat protein